MSQLRFFNPRFPSKASGVRISSPAPEVSRRLAQVKGKYTQNEIYGRLVLDVLLTDKTIEHYINGLYAEKKSPNTIFIYQYNLKIFTDFVKVQKLKDIQPQEIRGFLAHRAQNTRSATVHQAFRVLRTFFRWCLAEGLLEQNPMLNIKAPKQDVKVIQIFSSADIKNLISFCKLRTFLGERNRAIISLLLDSGMRAEELIKLSINDVDFRSGIIKVKGKGSKERLTKISDKARQYLWKYMLIRDIKAANLDRLFLSEELKPLTRRGLTTIIFKLGREAGLKGVRCSPHTFRHTWAINFLRNGGNIMDLRILGGWADLDSVKPYLSGISQQDALQAHERFSPGDRML